MTHRLLLVDDNLELAENLAEILDDLGYESDIATSAEDALERINTTRYLGIITDLRLPGCSGVELLVQLRAQGHTCPVVLISGYAAPEDQERAEAAGALDVLPKPVDLQRLISDVHAFEKTQSEVMVVEDDPELGENLVESLATQGFHPTLHRSGEEALATHRLPQIAVVDVRLPGLSGVDVARRLVARDPQLQLVVISGHVDRNLIAQVAALPSAAPVLEKPVSIERLTSEISKAPDP